MSDQKDRLVTSPDGSELLPAESIALTVALAQVRRGERPDQNVSTMCVLALARLSGRYDYLTALAEAAS